MGVERAADKIDVVLIDGEQGVEVDLLSADGVHLPAAAALRRQDFRVNELRHVRGGPLPPSLEGFDDHQIPVRNVPFRRCPGIDPHRSQVVVTGGKRLKEGIPVGM